MPFLTREQGDAARARGERVVELPQSPPDGLVHYASGERHFLCDPSSAWNKAGSPHWEKVTCPACLKQGKRTGRQEGGKTIQVAIDRTKARNQQEDVA
jgi:hypothetical protein